MAQPFLRIDLSNQAKDFQNTVIEAGWPLLDKSNTNYQILRKWLGGAVAEPERNGDEVLFYLRNEAGARIDQPNILKVSEKELTGPLKGELRGAGQEAAGGRAEKQCREELACALRLRSSSRSLRRAGPGTGNAISSNIGTPVRNGIWSGHRVIAGRTSSQRTR